jgi:hypothetical protein
LSPSASQEKEIVLDRPDIYPLEIIRSFDQQWGWRDGLIGNGLSNQAMLGKTDTVVQGFAWSQTPTPSLLMNFTSGMIYAQEPVDSTAWGNLASDSQLIMQQGYYAGGQLAFLTGGMSAGQSQWALVQITFAQTDAIRAGDPTNGVLPYVNVDDLTQPFEGPGGSGVAQPTVRKGVATPSIKYGVAASSSPVAPAADAGYVPLALVLLTFGQTAITTGDLQLASPAVYAGYPHAPYFPGVTGTIPNAPGGSHHGGVAGQAAKIDVTSEISGQVPFPNLPVSNGAPPAIGGIVTVAGDIPIISQGNGDPNGSLAGNQNDAYLDRVTSTLFICITSGNAASAVWTATGAGGLSQYENAVFTVLPGNYQYLCDTSGAGWTQILPTAASMGRTNVSFKNIGTNPLVIQPATGERLENLAANATMRVQPGEAVRFSPRSGYGFYITG